LVENRRWPRRLRGGLLLLLLSPLRATNAQERIAIGFEGGVATVFPTDLRNLVATAVPFRIDVGLRLSEHLWVAPFVGLAWIPGKTFSSTFPAPGGFRLLAGAELQLHQDTPPDKVQAFGGLGLAFERLVAHARVDACGHCEADSVSTIANGANLEFRAGLLFPLGKVVKLGPYVRWQLSWMPGLAPVSVQYPDEVLGPGGTTTLQVSPWQLWLDAGVRVVALP